MKAAQINKYGGSEVIEINEDAEKPSLKQGQVLVEVHAASLNPVDSKLRAGFLKEMVSLTFPVTLGGDFSGTVVEVGEDVFDFNVGDGVFGQAIVLNGGSGTLAQFVATNAANTALKPKSLDYTKSASLPLAGTSAIQGVEEHIKVSEGQKILIHGGAGGIGSLAIQIAKLHGAYVATTTSYETEEFVKNLGADEVIDFKSQDFSEILKDFDGVFDTVGKDVTNKSFKVLKKGGILVSMLGAPDPELAKQLEATAIGQGTVTDTQKLNRLTELIDIGKLKPQVDKVFSLEQIRQAFDYLEKEHPKGKVVISIQS